MIAKYINIHSFIYANPLTRIAKPRPDKKGFSLFFSRAR